MHLSLSLYLQYVQVTGSMAAHWPLTPLTPFRQSTVSIGPNISLVLLTFPAWGFLSCRCWFLSWFLQSSILTVTDAMKIKLYRMRRVLHRGTSSLNELKYAAVITLTSLPLYHNYWGLGIFTLICTILMHCICYIFPLLFFYPTIIFFNLSTWLTVCRLVLA